MPVPVRMPGRWEFEMLGELLKREVPLSRCRIRSLQPLSPFEVSHARDILGGTQVAGVQEGLRRNFGGH